MAHPVSRATRKSASASATAPSHAVAGRGVRAANGGAEESQPSSAPALKSKSRPVASSRKKTSQASARVAPAAGAAKKRSPKAASMVADAPPPAAAPAKSPLKTEKKTRTAKPKPAEIITPPPPEPPAPVVAPPPVAPVAKPAETSRKRGRKWSSETKDAADDEPSARKRSRDEARNLYEAAMTAFNQADFQQARDVLQLFISDFGETSDLTERARAFLKICEQRIEAAK